MKFVLTRKHLYWWPVTVAVPSPDQDRAGEMVEMTFKMRFESLPRDEAKAMQDRIRALPENEAEAESHADLMRVVKGWDDDVIDDDGKPVPFSPEALRKLLQVSWYRLGVYRAWAASLVGEAPRRGN
jgi:hypothetical protein